MKFAWARDKEKSQWARFVAILQSSSLTLQVERRPAEGN